ncbi:hypothetical protein R3W88_024261 [Solanum pinnatisectum]|uniref:Uncharacterized protein n=1 Tax=Solanum pinnatisectum TaxID=50273 RepID=A0AAV9LZR8_9SOLN|nr:hypothetical protein R3W88_024261 [Solanum pinnatisectum]
MDGEPGGKMVYSFGFYWLSDILKKFYWLINSNRKYRVRVLVCAPSNFALDEIVLHILNIVSIPLVNEIYITLYKQNKPFLNGLSSVLFCDLCMYISRKATTSGAS